MRPIYGYPANFRESLSTPTAILSRKFLIGFCVQNLKFVALPSPKIIGGNLKNWVVPGYAHAPFSPKFLTGFYSDGPCECTCQFEVRSISLPIPEIIAITVLGGDCEPPILGKRRP